MSESNHTENIAAEIQENGRIKNPRSNAIHRRLSFILKGIMFLGILGAIWEGQLATAVITSAILLITLAPLVLERFSGDGLPKPLGDFHTLNLTCGISFGRSKNNRLYAEIYNITDERYSTVVGYPDFGRRFNLGVRQIY